ncbi:MAG TPA: XRE family transcriptional regulator [Candidatus Aminicenantes bacterium]|nr:XRE family transcriptional regulator [Candidatus Aminicenantes bacterium]
MAFTLQDLGQNIRRIRLAKSSSFRSGRPMMQKELAELAGIPASSLCNIENGKYRNPTWEILSKIAQALGCDISEFFTTPQKEVHAAEIALREMIDLLVRERLESFLKEKSKII